MLLYLCILLSSNFILLNSSSKFYHYFIFFWYILSSSCAYLSFALILGYSLLIYDENRRLICHWFEKRSLIHLRAAACETDDCAPHDGGQQILSASRDVTHSIFFKDHMKWVFKILNILSKHWIGLQIIDNPFKKSKYFLLNSWEKRKSTNTRPKHPFLKDSLFLGHFSWR